MQPKKAGDQRGDGNTAEEREETSTPEPLSTLAETLVALAHEINQPLTAIQVNAQAALRFLDKSSPDLDEVRAALREIVEDNQRAAEGIRRLHELALESGRT